MPGSSVSRLGVLSPTDIDIIGLCLLWMQLSTTPQTGRDGTATTVTGTATGPK
jgi:hypothetical protein